MTRQQEASKTKYQVYFILFQLAGRCSESYTAGQEYRQGVDDEYYVSLAQERGFYSFREKQSAYVAASFDGI